MENSGGDTLIINTGSYQKGYGASNSGWCSSDYPYECHLPAPPSGPDSEHPTRILGSEQGCADPPELWGTERHKAFRFRLLKLKLTEIL